ncbi:hypothetical protein Q7C36_002815 [Tachysurus vachellii]|uniref:Uncharacterized protein n=1 Tax=Tachysurus vachellii TaxID=175792 RepID=A0AA88NYT0_TACVA|nr:hypothetical protein Q7C36_002815 [Tachysurus vachellii]
MKVYNKAIRVEIKEDSNSRGLKMTDVKMMRNQCGTAAAAGASTLNIKSEQKPKCFGDIVDLVLHLSDEDWMALSRGMTKKKVTRVEFAAACTNIVTAVSSAVVQRLLKPLSQSFGVEAILEANKKLKKMAESESSEGSASVASSQSSPMEVSDFICQLSQKIVTEIKGAMLEAIRSTVSRLRASASSPTEDPITQLDDLSIACTNEICDKILALYNFEEAESIGGESTPALSSSLDEVASIWSRSVTSVSVTDVPKTTNAAQMPSDYAPQAVSDEFISKASQMIAEILLKTDQTLCASMSSQTSVCSEAELTELANNAATEILQKSLTLLQAHASFFSSSDADQSGPEYEQKFLSFAQKIHMDIHKQVFKFTCERKQAVLEKSKTHLEAKLDVGTETVQEPATVEQFLDKATHVMSEILVNRLNTHISTDLISLKDSGSIKVPSLMESVELERVSSSKVNKVEISGVPLEMERKAQVGEAQMNVSEADTTPYPKSTTDISLIPQGLTGQDESSTDTEGKSGTLDQDTAYVPLNLFTVVSNQMKAFFTFFSKRAADDKSSVQSEREENSVIPIHTGEDSLVQELAVGRSLSDSFLLRKKSVVHYMRFPPELIYTFVEESAKSLLRNVLADESSSKSNRRNGINRRDGSNGSDGHSPHTAEGQEKMPKVRYVVKTNRILVVVHPKKQKKNKHTVPLPQAEHIHDAPHKKSVFKTMGRFFSNISKTFTNRADTETAPDTHLSKSEPGDQPGDR